MSLVARPRRPILHHSGSGDKRLRVDRLWSRAACGLHHVFLCRADLTPHDMHRIPALQLSVACHQMSLRNTVFFGLVCTLRGVRVARDWTTPQTAESS